MQNLLKQNFTELQEAKENQLRLEKQGPLHERANKTTKCEDKNSEYKRKDIPNSSDAQEEPEIERLKRL